MRRRQVIPILASIVLLILVTGAGSSTASPADWPMYRNNLKHTGVAGDVVPPPLSLKWKTTFGGSVVSSPAIVGSRIYVGVKAPDYRLYAIDAATGSIIWSFDDDAQTLDWESSPAVTSMGGKNVIFAGNDNHNLYAIRDDGATPHMLWYFSTGGNVYSPAVTTISGTKVVIFSTNATPGELYALVADTGGLYPGWLAENPFTEGGLTGPFYSSPAILGSTIFIGNSNGFLYAINLGSGVVLWQTDLLSYPPIYSSPAVDHVGTEDLVFVGADDNSMYAFAAASGDFRWAFNTGGVIRSSPAVATITNPPVACGPGPTLAVIFGSADGNMYAARASDGTQCWIFPSTGLLPFYSSPTVSGETVYFGSDDHNLYAININDGTWKWSFPSTSIIGDAVVTPNPAISGLTLYFGSNAPDSSLYAFQSSPPETTITTSVISTTTVISSTTEITTSVTTSTTEITTTTATTTTATSIAPPGPIPGFPIESILVGLLGGAVGLTLLGRRRRAR